MKFIKQTIADVLLIQPQIHGDSRGYFAETYRQDCLEQALGYKVNFCQDNESHSTQGVLRGLHYQLPPYAQSKLVRVIEGEVLDVAVDIRQDSPTFGQYVAVTLSAENKHQLFIPRGFAHGFIVTSPSATFTYKVDNYYAPTHDRGLAYNDPDININWPLDPAQHQLSHKDQHQPRLKDILSDCQQFHINQNLYSSKP